ncbi:MAG: type III restriction endonuclease [Gammaproteobacteria bacterium]|nr:MAG: type III restriction endonuclease [Gammaproteobacteria bacterium]
MENLKYLYDTIGRAAFDAGVQKPKIPDYIKNNLKYELFEWQQDAMINFLTFEELKNININQNPYNKNHTHLMFNMATGAGKTLVMAAAILYYYNQGYRHFLFFVNQTNIVDKTENNFIDSTHNKYLFKDKIIIDGKTVDIKQVDLFSDNPQGVEIKFTSTTKLHNDVHMQKENQTTLDDLHKKNIVMLADEAHHLNASTKKKDAQRELIPTELKESQIERIGWEHTVVDLILKKNNQNTENKNVLLEFTATIPNNEQVAKKYEDKTIYKFDLKEFLSAGYTKEINLISSTLDKKQRILQALLFQWYRHKIAIKNNIANFKPVILFRSNEIADSKTDYEEFINLMQDITEQDFDFIKTIAGKIYEPKQPSLFEQGKSRTEQMLNFIENENIKYEEIAKWMGSNFAEKNTIITNSEDKKAKGKRGGEKTTESQEKLLNSLEDKNNHIRAIFTVDRLTEDWDVLNLFDIVRLYRSSSNTTKKDATTQEKQLIGRGVRYFPFEFADKIKNKRKFTNDPQNELRILEELFYYTYDEDSVYISNLKKELRKDGYIPTNDNRVIKTFSLKNDFKNGDFYKNVKIWGNRKIKNPDRKKQTLDNIKDDYFEYKIKDLELTQFSKILDEYENENKITTEKANKTINLKFKNIEKHIINKVINIKANEENSIFQFARLKNELAITSMDDLQKDKFLGDFDIKIIINKNKTYDDIDNIAKLDMTGKFLNRVFTKLKENITPHKGSEFFAEDFKKYFSEPKTKTINKDNSDDNIAKDNNWYVLDRFVGTSEEKALIGFIKKSIGNLSKKYNEIYLLRNEELYKIYDFEKGRGFMPDFILFLKNNSLSYQIFIEPKGDKLLEPDKWKEDFLEQITQKYSLQKIIKAENKNYKLIGLPFYNENQEPKFEKEYCQLYKPRYVK